MGRLSELAADGGMTVEATVEADYPGSLTARQVRFVEEYLIDLNGTKAAIRAGYSAKTARVIASQNLKKNNVTAAIAKAQQARSERTGITQDRVLLRAGRLREVRIDAQILENRESIYMPSRRSRRDDDVCARTLFAGGGSSTYPRAIVSMLTLVSCA